MRLVVFTPGGNQLKLPVWKSICCLPHHQIQLLTLSTRKCLFCILVQLSTQTSVVILWFFIEKEPTLLSLSLFFEIIHFNHSLRLYLAPCTHGSSAHSLALLWPLFIPTLSMLLLNVSCLFAWCGFCKKHFLRAPISAPFGRFLWFPCCSAVILLCFPTQPCSPTPSCAVHAALFQLWVSIFEEEYSGNLFF